MKRAAGLLLLGLIVVLAGCGGATSDSAPTTSAGTTSTTVAVPAKPQVYPSVEAGVGAQLTKTLGAKTTAVCTPDGNAGAVANYACNWTNGAGHYTDSAGSVVTGSMGSVVVQESADGVVTWKGGTFFVTEGRSISTSSTTATQVFVEIGGKDVVRPSEIGFSADSGNIARDLVWSGWGSPEAVAHGTDDEETCDPDCASGPTIPTPVTIMLKDLQGDVYQEIAEAIQGMPKSTDAFGSTKELPGNTPLSATTVSVPPPESNAKLDAIAYQDLQGTWTDPAMNFDVTVYPETNSTTVLTTNLGGQGTPTPNGITFTNVQASSGTLFLGYELTTDPNGDMTEVGVEDGAGPIFTAHRATVVVDIGNRDVVEPSIIGLGGTVGPTAKNLRWAKWGTPTAVAHGTVDVQGSSPRRAELELTDLKAGFYQQLVLLVNSWPPETFTATQLNNAAAA